MAVTDLDTATAEEFAHRTLTTVNGAMLSLGISLGHRLGLYDVMADLGAATSEELAREAGLHERYVREWLAGQLAFADLEDDVLAAFRDGGGVAWSRMERLQASQSELS
jgi:winged helix-turn-helix protein